MTGFETAARAHIASRGSPETRSIYLADLARWVAFCELEGVSVDAPSFDVAVKFRDMLVDKYAAPTVRRILSALSSMYDAAAIVNHFKSSKRLPRPETDSIGITQEFTEAEAQALLRAAEEEAEKTENGLRDHAVLRTLYDTGMRITEVVSMRRDGLTKVGDGFQLVAKVKKKGRVETSIPPTATRVIERWLEVVRESRYVFPAPKGAGPLPRRAISKRLLIYGKRVGVKNAHPHRFRATYATTAFTAGVPLLEVAAALHHADPKTSIRYDRGVRGTGVSATVASFREGKR